MYFKAKRNVTMTNHITGGSWHLIKKDNIYKGEYSPKMYDPNTFQTVINLIITCEDGKSRYDKSSKQNTQVISPKVRILPKDHFLLLSII